VCLDTCHLYAAGYDIARPKGYEQTIADFDRTYTEENPPEQAIYRVSAPTLFARASDVAARLDAIARFRGELFAALVSGGQTPEKRRERDARVAELARRWGLPSLRACAGSALAAHRRSARPDAGSAARLVPGAALRSRNASRFANPVRETWSRCEGPWCQPRSRRAKSPRGEMG
jgi:hypothetical protein